MRHRRHGVKRPVFEVRVALSAPTSRERHRPDLVSRTYGIHAVLANFGVVEAEDFANEVWEYVLCGCRCGFDVVSGADGIEALLAVFGLPATYAVTDQTGEYRSTGANDRGVHLHHCPDSGGDEIL